jgi:macrolide-specific efflux system membrane fusion protein
LVNKAAAQPGHNMDTRSWKFLAKVITITFLLASCGAKPETMPTVMPTLKVVQAQKPIYIVQRGDIQEEVRLTGHFRPESQASVSFRIGGQVKGVYGKVGDKVTKGQLLADLEEADTLLSAQTIKKRELRRVEIGLEMAQLNLDAFQALPLTDYQKQFEVPRLKYLVELAQIDLDLARLRASDFNAQVEDYQVIAPQDGEIIRLDVTQGQSVTALMPAVTIADTSRLLILMQPEQDVARNLVLGMPVTYDTKDAPDKIYDAKITAIPESDSDRQLAGGSDPVGFRQCNRSIG